MPASPGGKRRMVDLAEYVQPKEAAEIVGCTKGRIYQMLRDGDFRDEDLIFLGEKPRLIRRSVITELASSPAKTGRPRTSKKSA